MNRFHFLQKSFVLKADRNLKKKKNFAPTQQSAENPIINNLSLFTDIDPL